MIRPGVAAPIRGIAPLAPTEPIDARALIFNAPEFGAEEVANLRHAMGGDGLSAVRQSFAELRDQADDPNPPQRTLIVAGIVAYLLGQHHLALKYLSNISGVGIADYYRGMVLLGQQDYAEAAEAFEEAGKQRLRPDSVQALQGGRHPAFGQDRGGRTPVAGVGSRGGHSAPNTRTRWAASAPTTETSLAPSSISSGLSTWIPHHTAALFRLANEMNLPWQRRRRRSGCTNRPCRARRSTSGAMINLGLFYEDKELIRRPPSAFAACCSSIRTTAGPVVPQGHPGGGQHVLRRGCGRAQQRELEQVMRIPIGDFELSARSRNCLERAGIETLGDLTPISEHDLLSSKNFGETSLREIREHPQDAAGLSIGQFARPVAARRADFHPETISPQEQAVLKAPVGDLNLSVRARKCLSRLGLVSIGELVSRKRPTNCCRSAISA